MQITHTFDAVKIKNKLKNKWAHIIFNYFELQAQFSNYLTQCFEPYQEINNKKYGAIHIINPH